MKIKEFKEAASRPEFIVACIGLIVAPILITILWIDNLRQKMVETRMRLEGTWKGD